MGDTDEGGEGRGEQAALVKNKKHASMMTRTFLKNLAAACTRATYALRTRARAQRVKANSQGWPRTKLRLAPTYLILLCWPTFRRPRETVMFPRLDSSPARIPISHERSRSGNFSAHEQFNDLRRHTDVIRRYTLFSFFFSQLYYTYPIMRAVRIR